MVASVNTSVRSPNFTSGRSGNKVAEIIIHHWGPDGSTHDGVVSWLCNPAAGTSAHYVVSGGRVNEIVSPDDTAWHAGSFGVNLTSVGIENRPECSAADFEETAQTIARLRKRYGWIPLRGHQQVTQTACPGRWQAKLAALSARADAIGQAHPVGLYVETFGTEKVDPARISAAIRDVFDLRPLAIIRDLDLQRPIYARTAAHGHFGREEPGFTWELTDRADALRTAAGL